MSRLSTILAAIALWGAPITAQAVDSVVPPGVEPVRLKHPTIACANRAVLDRIAAIMRENGATALDERDCHRFTDFRGDVVKETEYDICVLGDGNTQCMWFQRAAFVPAHH
jgi:hypothetical protein